MVRASGQDVSWTSPRGVVLGMLIQEETPKQTKGRLERLYPSTGLGTSRRLPRGLGGWGRGVESLDLSAQGVAPTTWTRISDKK